MIYDWALDGAPAPEVQIPGQERGEVQLRNEGKLMRPRAGTDGGRSWVIFASLLLERDLGG